MNNDLISIILPVYNGEKTIKETIESILNQTYQNFQLIIVDDGSTDKTKNICEKYISDNVEFYHNSNHGVSYSRNFAIDKCKGEYLVFIDSDDLYCKEYLETMISLMSKNKYDLVCCGYESFDKNEKMFFSNKETFNGKEEYIEELQSNLIFNQIWNKMYKTEVIKENNISFDTELSIAEDLKFNVEYLSKINSITNTSNVLYKYRITNNGLGFKYRDNIGEIKIDLITEIKQKISNGICTEFISESYIKQYFFMFSNILDNRNKISKKLKYSKIKKVVQEKKYNEIIFKCNVKSKKMKILLSILKTRNTKIIIIFSKIANLYDRLYKKRRLGL